MLTDEQIAIYRQQGYLLVKQVFSPQEVARLQSITAQHVEAARQVVASNEAYDLGPGHSAKTPKVRRIKDPHLRDSAYAAAASSERLLDALAGLIGPDIRFDHSKLNFKPVGGQAAIEWHQDWAFYPHTNDDLLAVGILLEDCGPEDGPLMVLPGSHKGPVFDHHDGGLFVGALDPSELGGGLDTAVALAGKAGDCTIHHVRTVHGSRENRGHGTRPLLLFSYAAVDAWPLVDQPDLAAFDQRILRGKPTLAPRQVALPVRLPLPRDPEADSIFDNQASVAGRSFAAATTELPEAS